MNRRSAVVVVVILAIVAAGLYLIAKDPFGLGRAPAVFAVIAASLITFFWIADVSGADSVSPEDDERLQRKGIASAILVQYLILVAIFAFWKEDPGDPASALSEVTKLLINNFTTIVGVVFAFYFGASAFVEAKTRSQSGAGRAAGKGETDKAGSSGSAASSSSPST